jgi:hypothetical protein
MSPLVRRDGWWAVSPEADVPNFGFEPKCDMPGRLRIRAIPRTYAGGTCETLRG